MMKKEIVYSTIHYTGKDAENADFWKECYHPDDITPDLLTNGKRWFKYTVQFQGLKPIQITKLETI